MVKIKVDLEHREDLRRLHTATHIVNFCARKILGNHVWQNGSNLKKEFGTLDITHYENLTLEEVFEIEKLANKTVFENKKVTIEELNRAEAEKKYGYILYQGGAIPMKKLRVINVLDSDVEACGGIHMESTGGIGLIKIVDSQKIQDGVIRLKYVVREFAEEYIFENQKIISKLKNFYGVDDKNIEKTSLKFFEEWKNQKKEIDSLNKLMLSVFFEFFSKSKEQEFDIKIDLNMGALIELFSMLLKLKKRLKLSSSKFIIATTNFNVKDFKKEIKKYEYNIYIK